MSLLLGIRLPELGQVVVMADTRTRSSDVVVASYRKVRRAVDVCRGDGAWGDSQGASGLGSADKKDEDD